MKYLYALFLVLLASPCFTQENIKSLEVREIASGVYLHTSYQQTESYGMVDSNGLVVVESGNAYIIDTPWSPEDTQALLSWIEAHGFTVMGSVSTHYHEDRTAGIAVLNASGIPTYTSKLTHELLIKKGQPTATHIFNDEEFLWREGVVEVFYPGAGHTADNLVVWLPKHNLLFGGCLVRSVEWNGLGYTGDASLEGWADTIRAIQNKYAPAINTVVPGHGKPGDSEILDHTIRLAESAANAQKLSNE